MISNLKPMPLVQLAIFTVSVVVVSVVVVAVTTDRVDRGLRSDTTCPAESTDDQVDTPNVSEPITDVDNALVSACDSPIERRWAPLGEPGNGGWVTEIAFSPFDADAILAGGDVTGMVRSGDSGRSWARFRTTELRDRPDHLASHRPRHRLGRHAQRSASLVRCRPDLEAARSGMPAISPAEFTAPVEVVLFDPANVERLLAFGGNRRESALTGDLGLPGDPAWGAVWETLDGGDTWTKLGQVSPGGVVTDASFIGNDILLAAVDEVGLFRSDNDGASWSQVGDGLSNPNVRDIEVNPTTDSVFVAVEAAFPNGTLTPGFLARSSNGGLDFETCGCGYPQHRRSRRPRHHWHPGRGDRTIGFVGHVRSQRIVATEGRLGVHRRRRHLDHRSRRRWPGGGSAA